MLDAKLINQIPCCPNCESSLGNTQDYGMVEYEGNKYLQFVRRCNKCNENVQYCETELGEKESRIVFPNEDIKKIKEEVKKVSEE